MDVSLSACVFWFVMTCLFIHIWGYIDGTHAWYKENQRQAREGYVPLRKD